MWNRKELKQRAKDALKRNYWKIVLVTTLSMTLGGGLSYSMSSSGGKASGIVASDTITTDEVNNVDYGEEYEAGYEEETYGEEAETETIVENTPDDADTVTDGGADEMSQDMDTRTKVAFGVSIVVFALLFALIIIAVVFTLIELLYNPFYVGVQRFMLKSVDDRSEVREIVYGFDHSYKNIVKTMFQRDIKVLLWSLLLFIPGIYKNYQYRMVPYILAEQPDMDWKQALQMSKDMMDGEKWRAFVLDMSFIPWHALCMITCGIVSIVYAAPYIELTNASLYRAIEDKKRAEGKAGIEDGI